MVTKELETAQPNIGSGREVYTLCPNCSKMYLSTDNEGHDETLPRECKRCRCPMVAGEDSADFMDLTALEFHDEAVAVFGAQYRGGDGRFRHKTEAAIRAEIEAEVRAEYEAKAKPTK